MSLFALPHNLLTLAVALMLLALFSVPLVAAAEEGEEPAEEEIASTVDELAGEEDADAESAESETEPAAENPYPDGDFPTCFITEERWDTSASKVEALFMDRGQLKRVRFISLAYMVIGIKLFEENKLGLSLHKVSVVDYSSFGTPNERMIELGLIDQQVWFVLSEEAIAGSKAPYIAAFTDEQQANDFASRRESSVLSYEDIMTKIIKRMNADEQENFDENIGFTTQ
jgi:nitrous oxide reductase accessory protein NosL